MSSDEISMKNDRAVVHEFALIIELIERSCHSWKIVPDAGIETRYRYYARLVEADWRGQRHYRPDCVLAPNTWELGGGGASKCEWKKSV